MATVRFQPLPRLGRRGGGWVAVQVVLLGAIFLSALVGLEWPGWIEPYMYGAGAFMLAVGGALLAAGGAWLARAAAVTPFPAPRPGSELQTAGVYRWARHPMYGGGIVLGLGWSIVFATPFGLALTAVLAVFAELKSRREELWLQRTFDGYRDYRKATPHRFVPFLW